MYNTLLNPDTAEVRLWKGASGGYSAPKNKNRKGQEEEKFYMFGNVLGLFF